MAPCRQNRRRGRQCPARSHACNTRQAALAVLDVAAADVKRQLNNFHRVSSCESPRNSVSPRRDARLPPAVYRQTGGAPTAGPSVHLKQLPADSKRDCQSCARSFDKPACFPNLPRVPKKNQTSDRPTCPADGGALGDDQANLQHDGVDCHPDRLKLTDGMRADASGSGIGMSMPGLMPVFSTAISSCIAASVAPSKGLQQVCPQPQRGTQLQ